MDRDDLRLNLIVGNEGSRAREVVGAHSIDVDHPARWLDRGWIMLTTGLQLKDDTDAQRSLVRELDQAGIAALGYGVDIVHSEVPRPLLHEAERVGFPIFTIPLGTAFRNVISEVYRSVLSGEIRVSNRLVAMQRFLMDSLGDESPRITVLRRLASLVDSTVGVILRNGTVVISTRDLPSHEIAEAIRASPATSVAFELTGIHGFALPVGDPQGRDTQWLVVAVPDRRSPHPLAKAAAQATVPLLIAMADLERARQSQDQAVRTAALEALLAADDRGEARVAASRTAACGVPIESGVVALVAAPFSGDVSLPLVLPQIDAGFSDMQLPVLGSVIDNRLVFVLSAPVSDQLIAERILEVEPSLRVGVGRTVTTPFDIVQSRRDATLALESRRMMPDNAIVRYDDLDLGTILMNEVPFQRLEPKIRAWLVPLRDKPLIYETLVCYLRHDLDVGRTARALGLHPNSVRYRLMRAEEVIGAPLRSPSTLLALQVVLWTDPMDASEHRDGSTEPPEEASAPTASRSGDA